MADAHAQSAGESLAVMFARFEGKVTAELSNLGHDVKNLSLKLEAYATSRDLKAAEDRVEKLEKNMTWITRTVVGTIVTAVIGGAATWAAVGSKALH